MDALAIVDCCCAVQLCGRNKERQESAKPCPTLHRRRHVAHPDQSRTSGQRFAKLEWHRQQSGRDVEGSSEARHVFVTPQ